MTPASTSNRLLPRVSRSRAASSGSPGAGMRSSCPALPWTYFSVAPTCSPETMECRTLTPTCVVVSRCSAAAETTFCASVPGRPRGRSRRRAGRRSPRPARCRAPRACCPAWRSRSWADRRRRRARPRQSPRAASATAENTRAGDQARRIPVRRRGVVCDRDEGAAHAERPHPHRLDTLGRRHAPGAAQGRIPAGVSGARSSRQCSRSARRAPGRCPFPNIRHMGCVLYA